MPLGERRRHRGLAKGRGNTGTSFPDSRRVYGGPCSSRPSDALSTPGFRRLHGVEWL